MQTSTIKFFFSWAFIVRFMDFYLSLLTYFLFVLGILPKLYHSILVWISFYRIINQSIANDSIRSNLKIVSLAKLVPLSLWLSEIDFFSLLFTIILQDESNNFLTGLHLLMETSVKFPKFPSEYKPHQDSNDKHKIIWLRNFCFKIPYSSVAHHKAKFIAKWCSMKFKLFCTNEKQFLLKLWRSFAFKSITCFLYLNRVNTTLLSLWFVN